LRKRNGEFTGEMGGNSNGRLLGCTLYQGEEKKNCFSVFGKVGGTGLGGKEENHALGNGGKGENHLC